MVDTTTPLLGLLLQATGGNNNSWGDNLNTDVITLIDVAIAGGLTITPGATTYSLSATEARYSSLIIQGPAPITITVPTLAKSWRIYNQTNGIVLIKTASQTSGVNIPLNKTVDCFMDVASSIVRRLDADRVGEMFYHGGTNAPAGAIVCNGAMALIAEYPDLWTQIGVTWGGNGTTTFGIPNGQDTGRFLRSSASGLAVGTGQTNQNKAHTHTGSGTSSAQSADHSHTGSGTTSGQSVSHTHNMGTNVNGASVPQSSPTVGVIKTDAIGGNAIAPFTGAASVDHSHIYAFTTSGISVGHTHTYSFTTSSDGGTEARPESLVGILCIRY